MVKNIINEFLYTGAEPGEKLATQQAVKNMSYGQIGKNIVDEGGFGYGKNLRGYDPNYTGKGAIPRNTAFQKMMAFPKYAAGAFNLGDKASNLAGGTPGQRQLYEKVLQSPVSKAGAGIMNFAPKALRTLASGPAQAAFFTLGSTPANASEANMSPEDFRALAEAEGMTFGSSPITSSPFVDAGRNFSMFDQARMGDAVSGTNVQGMDLEMDPAAQEGFLNPDIQPSQNMFQRAGNFINDLDLEEYLPFIGERSLTGIMGRGIGNLFQNIAPARYGTSQRAYNALSPQGRSAVGSIYGPGGIMQGYNAVSAFGRGPAGAIQNRIDNILGRKAAQTAISRQRVKDLQAALTNVGGGDSGGGGGYSQSSVDAGVQAAEDDR